ncbi:helix-turn-helix domain-containing protein [Sphingomonas aerolata]|uniref:helix-turn-helix domain-containing protein n=1 Tax=Sphingomonas aerolata TaxID=185951 RepID=UPI003A5C4F57
MPFPSMKTLAVRSGVSERQVQRAINRLDELGLMKRVKRKTKGIIASNAYDLNPLTEILSEVASAFPNEFPRKIRLVREDSSKESE